MMNGSNGITPTVELATTNGNGFYPYPMFYGNNGGFGNGAFGGDSAIWLIVLLALIWGNNGNGLFGGNNGGNRGFNDSYAWLSNGQKEIMTNTNNGFDTLHLSNQLDTINGGIYSLSNQMCNCCSDINSNISNGFYNSEISANNRQMADMQQNFSNQIATLQGFNNLNNALSNCCCENRLANCQTQNIIQNEGNATRFADANNTRDLLTNQTANTQAILDKLCQLELDAKQDKIDAKNEKISELQRELQMADLRASQVAQTADIRANNAVVANQLVSELRSCPIPAQPVYGNQPIFTCPANYNGCGCGNYSNII